eukprot:sb/3473773/
MYHSCRSYIYISILGLYCAFCVKIGRSPEPIGHDHISAYIRSPNCDNYIPFSLVLTQSYFSAYFMSLEGDIISFMIADNKFTLYTVLVDGVSYQSDSVSRLHHTAVVTFGGVCSGLGGSVVSGPSVSSLDPETLPDRLMTYDVRII